MFNYFELSIAYLHGQNVNKELRNLIILRVAELLKLSFLKKKNSKLKETLIKFTTNSKYWTRRLYEIKYLKGNKLFKILARNI